MRTKSFRFKIKVLFTAILFAVLVVFGAVLIFSVKHILYKDLDRDFKAKAIQIEAILDAYSQIRANASHPAVMLQNLVSEGNISAMNMDMVNKLWHADVKALNIQYDYFRVISAKGKSILFSENYPKLLSSVFTDTVTEEMISRELITNISFNGEKYRFINYPLKNNPKTNFSLQIATPIGKIYNVLFNFSTSVLLAIFFIILFTAIFGNLFAERILKPIMNVINVADTITHKDLSVRISDTGEYDETKTLISSLNIMIERLERSFKHINEFSSHVAHELKTPLAIMKGELELALNSVGVKDERREILETLVEEVDRLIITIKDMLLLAKLEYDASVYKFEKINLSTFFKNIYEQSLILTEVKGINLNLEIEDKNIEAMGDKTHLRRVFFNIINNAVKYTPAGGLIKIKISVKNGKVHVDISDNGEGISAQNLDKIFNKFFRGSKDESQVNVGLGLNIALSIIRAHRGDITVKSVPGEGATFTIIFPLQ